MGYLGSWKTSGQPAHVTGDVQIQLRPVATEHNGAGAQTPWLQILAVLPPGSVV